MCNVRLKINMCNVRLKINMCNVRNDVSQIIKCNNDKTDSKISHKNKMQQE